MPWDPLCCWSDICHGLNTPIESVNAGTHRCKNIPRAMHHLLFPLFCQPHTPQLFLFSPKSVQKEVRLTEPVHYSIFVSLQKREIVWRRGIVYFYFPFPNRSPSHILRKIDPGSIRRGLNWEMTHAKNEYNSISARRFIKNFIGPKSGSRFDATGETMAGANWIYERLPAYWLENLWHWTFPWLPARHK